MKSAVYILFFLTVLLFSCKEASLNPFIEYKDKPQEQEKFDITKDFPNGLGRFWVYKVSEERIDSLDQCTLEITIDREVTLRDGQKAMNWHYFKNARIPLHWTSQVLFAGDTVKEWRDSLNINMMDPVVLHNILVYPLVVGKGWSTPLPAKKPGEPKADSCYISSISSIETPAGEFDSVFVINEYGPNFDSHAKTYRYKKHYFCPKVGYVQFEQILTDGQRTTKEVEWKLERYGVK